MLQRAIFIALIAASLSGCSVRMQMQRWVGASEVELLESVGPPIVEMEFPNGIRALRYARFITKLIDATPALEPNCMVNNDSSSGEIWTCLGTNLLDPRYQESISEKRARNIAELSSGERRTYYIDENGEVFLWTQTQYTETGDQEFRYGPHEPWAVEAITDLREMELELLRRQGGPSEETRGVIRTDIFADPRTPPEDKGPDAISEFILIDLPLGVYRAGDAMTDLFSPDAEPAEPEGKPRIPPDQPGPPSSDVP